MNELQAGDILSYSASSTQSGPTGFRIIRSAVSYLPSLLNRWPELATQLGTLPPIMINAYPAYIGRFEFGIFVDTYLSIKTGLRALQLAAQEQRSAFLMGQPLFVAELIWQAHYHKITLPTHLILACGGYELPLSLEQTIRSWIPSSVQLTVLYAYGVAELDAACLVGLYRNPSGEILYYPRDTDIYIRSDQGQLCLAYAPSGHYHPVYNTGDLFRWQDEALIITPAPERMSPQVHTELQQWSSGEWERRTGYVHMGASGNHFQLREGAQPEQKSEYTHFQYADRFGFNWQQKPDWRWHTSTNMYDSDV